MRGRMLTQPDARDILTLAADMFQSNPTWAGILALSKRRRNTASMLMLSRAEASM